MHDWIETELQSIKAAGRWRSLRYVEGPQAERIILDGKEVINLCSNNYLGLANHPRLKAAARSAIDKYGCGSGASRLICGNSYLYGELEEALANFKGEERALVFSTGYHANMGLIPVLAGEGATVYSDALNHASIIDGIRLTKGIKKVFPHGDVNALRKLMKEGSGSKKDLLVTESVFSMDGDLAPLVELKAAADEFGVMMMVDEAHATGVMGENGRGYVNEVGLSGKLTAVMGTLGKGLGSFGAYICGRRELIDLLINRARQFIFTTALPPASLAAALEAIRILEEDDSRRLNLWENINFFVNELKSFGFDTGESASPIIPLMIGDNFKTMDCCRRLLEKGVFIQGIRPPTVPEGKARLRISLMATHRRDDLEKALEAIVEVGHELELHRTT